MTNRPRRGVLASGWRVLATMGALMVATGVMALKASAATPPADLASVGPAPTRYMAWEAIELPASSGASCGNGTPYRFFVNRSLHPTGQAHTAVVFEGGGACWDQNSCSGFGKGGLLSATNPKGVPLNYMSLRTQAGTVAGLASPVYTRNHPLQKVQTQTWNLVFLPYCTGDVYSGSKTVVYADATPTQPLTYQHKGFVNAQAVARWLAARMPQPDKLLITGFSAGAAGATANYPFLREAMAPRQAALLADSGPIFPAPEGGTVSDYPSLPVQTHTRQAWGLLAPGGQIEQLNQKLGSAAGGPVVTAVSVNVALARRYPQDRFGYSLYQRDGVYSEFSYARFFPEIIQAGSALRKSLVFAKWDQDIGNWITDLQTAHNTGYYLPWKGVLPLSHCLTVLGFKDTGILSLGLSDVGAFIDNLLDPRQPLIRAVSAPLFTVASP